MQWASFSPSCFILANAYQLHVYINLCYQKGATILSKLGLGCNQGTRMGDANMPVHPCVYYELWRETAWYN